MSYKTILVAASGGSATDGAVEAAAALAARFDAHLEGLHVRSDPRDILVEASAGATMPMPQEVIDRLNSDIEADASAAKASFAAAAARHGLAEVSIPAKGGASMVWNEVVGNASATVAARARFFDLVVLGRSDRVDNKTHTDAVEQTLINSGRPVLLAGTASQAGFGKSIAIGWSGSAQGVRAVVAALPLLAGASRVLAITVGDPADAAAASLVEYLAWRGIKATDWNIEKPSGVSTGEQLLTAAHGAGADLVVVGGFGHAPWREALFGGATNEIVGTSLLPLLLAH